MTATYDWYHKVMAGAKPGSPEAPIHADHPQPGFFRLPRRNGNAVPVAIFPDYPGGVETLIAFVGTLRDQREIAPTSSPYPDEPIDNLWLLAAKYPVAEAAYRAAYAGKGWPDVPQLPPSADGTPLPNTPADDFETLCDQVESAIGLASKFEKVEDQATADQVANLKDRLAEYGNKLEAMRLAEKRPHDDAAKAVQKKFTPRIERAVEAVGRLRRLLTPYLNKLNAAAEQAARTAVEAASGGGNEAPPVSSPTVHVGGAYGRKTGTREKITSVEIEDYALALEATKDESEVREAVLKVAKRRARAKVETPGVKVTREKEAQ